MRVLVVDDHPLMLSGVQDVIAEAWPDAVCDGVPQADAALRAVSGHSYDLVCVDLGLPDLGGVELIRRLRRSHPSLPIIVLSATDHVTQVAEALEAGAQGYLVKALARPDLVDALLQFRATGHYLPAALRDALARQRGEGAGETGVPRLTRRQRDVLSLMAQGLGNQAIAAHLALSESTVKGHVSCLLDLLDADNRTACVNHARALGLLDA